MPEIQFKGKEFVFNHHLSVPYRPLVPHKGKSIGAGNINENLVIHGDNLHALKALMPMYAGKIDCIFIDPPYNTGNEGWSYNDNVNSPMLKEWLSSNPINKEDMLRHDKWLAMMYPRVKLLHELLSEQGSFWMTLDDHEMHRARMMLDEIFGATNFVASIVWQKKQSPQSDAINISDMHDYLIVYAKNAKVDKKDQNGWQRRLVSMSDGQLANYGNPDGDARGLWTDADYTCAKTAEARPNLYYPITNPNTGEEVWPSKTRVWAYEKSAHEANVREKLIWWPPTRSKPRIKTFLKEGELEGTVPGTWWPREIVGDNQEAKQELLGMFESAPHDFQTPKPVRLISRILEIATHKDSLVLDSFAGSATTGHAVLAANHKDGGNRKFILVECESYADALTSERIRRVINGYQYQGTIKETLHTENVSFSTLKNAHKILDQIAGIENLEAHKYDKIKKEIKDDKLIVFGEKKITEQVDGTGGSFTYCTLGEPIGIDKILTGENLPDYQAIGSWLFHTATGEALNVTNIKETEFFLGESNGYFVWLIYKPGLEFLKSRDSALTLAFAEKIANNKNKKHLVFAPAKYVPNKTLLPLGVEYAPLPFALYRVEK
jgi:adenine-specific DNA-methyltransferase